MALVIAGIDEAGYGPLLGPMCVGMSVLRLEDWREGDAAPDLWSLLAPQVERRPGKSGAVAIDDSKKLKLSNDSATLHPLAHLERAVLSCLRCHASAPAAPADDAALHEALGASLPPFDCYAGSPITLPVAWSDGQVQIASNLLRAAFTRASVSLLALRCDAVGEDRFNQTVERTGTKASVTLRSIAGHLRSLLALPLFESDSLRIVCDRLGGRTEYASVLERMAREIDPGAAVSATEESDRRSRYELVIGGRPIGVLFQTEGDSAHLPIALASMVAKYVRELAMTRFNRHWCERYSAAGRNAGEGSVAELKPTAGYRNDATRWLRDAATILSAEDRRALIRKAQRRAVVPPLHLANDVRMADARRFLDMAARLALRGMGHVEPNPMVGAVLVKDGRIIGLGHHRRFGHLHAEREAIESARRQGHDPRGSTIYVTLEPCCHHGKQPPCTDALINAGVARVVYARPDPNPVSRGGAEVLRARGIAVEHSTASPAATAVSLPFIKNITTDLPFVFAKWAQTIDGRLATRTGDSKWISGPLSRRRVHAFRGRVDAILTGIGTVLADNPRLTARDVPPRRTARRVVLDARLRTPPDSPLFADVRAVPVIIFTEEAAAKTPRAAALRSAGAVVETLPSADGQLDLHRALRALRERHSAHTVMVEAGPTLLGSLFAHDLIDAAVVHVAPRLLGDPGARAPVIGPADRVADSRVLALAHARTIGGDAELIYLRPSRP